MRGLHRTAIAVILAAVSACGGDVAPIVLTVTRGGDSGSGSLREALLTASFDPNVTEVRFASDVSTVSVTAQLEYTGAQALTLQGDDVVLDATGCECGILRAGRTASLSVRGLIFRGGGGTALELTSSEGEGPVSLSVTDSSIEGAGLHGIHVDDQSGGYGFGADSDRGVRVELRRVRVSGTGFRPGVDDLDGIRVDEGGLGGIVFEAEDLVVEGNAGDGVELDERGPGDVRARVTRARFVANGSQPQLPEDLEDGFDIDESGEGLINLRMVDVTASENHDTGIDVDESGPGDGVVFLQSVTAEANLDGNIRIGEDVEGSDPEDRLGGTLRVDVSDLTLSASTTVAMELTELGPGDFQAGLNGGTLSISAGRLLELRQSGDGEGRFDFQGVEGFESGEVAAEGVAIVAGG